MPAIVARAEKLLRVLRSTPCFDEQRAALFLENVRTLDEHEEDDPRFVQIIDWVGDHAQSVDWLFRGDPA